MEETKHLTEKEPKTRVRKERRRRLKLELLGLLPRVVGVSEVTVRGGDLVLGLLKVELHDDRSRSEVEVLGDDLDELLVRLLGGSVRVNEDGERLGDTDGVRELDEASSGEAGVDERLCDPSGGVGGGSVDLGPVLSGEGSSSVGSPSSVGVDNDLSASQSGVSLRSSDNESARGLHL